MGQEGEDVDHQVAKKTTSHYYVVPRSPSVFRKSPAGAESGFEHPVDLRVPPFLSAVMLQMKVAAKEQSPLRSNHCRKIPVFAAIGRQLLVKSQGSNRRPAIDHAKPREPLHRSASAVGGHETHRNRPAKVVRIARVETRNRPQQPTKFPA